MTRTNTIREFALVCVILLLSLVAGISSITRATRSDEPLTTQTPSITPTRTPTGVIGWRGIHGQVSDFSATPQPISGASVDMRHTSYRTATSWITVTTDLSGAYSFEPIYLYESDRVRIHVEAEGYASQEETRGGIVLYSNYIFDFTLRWPGIFHLPIIFK